MIIFGLIPALLVGNLTITIWGAQTSGKRTESGPAPSAAAKAEDCGCETSPPDLLATVNGGRLMIGEIDEPIKDRIRSTQQQVIDARQKELDLQINSALLETEAKRRGITPVKLLELEVGAKVKQPTAQETEVFYQQNKTRLEGKYEELKEAIANYLLNQRHEEEAKKLADILRSKADIKLLGQSVDSTAAKPDPARVLAIVNGRVITASDIEESLQPLVFNVQEAVYNLRKEQLELKINDLLLKQEAQKRKVTVAALLDQEIKPHVKKVTDEDVKRFYDENRASLGYEYKDVRARLIEYLQAQEDRNAQRIFAEQLRKAGSVETFLKPPDQPSYKISIDDQPAKGADNAQVTIVEFTDFECPACASTHPVLEELVNEYAGKVRLVVRDYPLDRHTKAPKAAEAAEAAREQGKYWQYAALLFQNQSSLEIDKLKAYASQLGLDRARFDAALDSGKFSDLVQTDLREGTKIGVDATPAIFVNGRRLREIGRDAIKSAIDATLSNQGSSRSGG